MSQYTRERMDGDFAVMLLGLKRDLRVEQEGVIYPQEVSEQATDRQDKTEQRHPQSAPSPSPPPTSSLSYYVAM